MLKGRQGATELHGIDEARGVLAWAGRELPQDYMGLLAESNGFVAHGGAFRFFPYGQGGLLADALEWNRALWRSEYGELLAAETYIWAENVFGNQYVYVVSGEQFRLAKFLCEGGRLEPIAWPNVTTFLQREVFAPDGKAVDMELVREALAIGLAPTARQHLSFRLPLIYGGKYEASNLEVGDASLHLSLLGQMSRQNASLPVGTVVRDFIEE
jgi:hypothetical protein